MVNQPPPSTFENRTHGCLDNTSTSQRYTTLYQECVHSPEPPLSRGIPPAINEASFTFGAPPIGGPAAGNVGRPPAQYTNCCQDRRLPPLVFPVQTPSGPHHQDREEDPSFDLPNYRGPLVLTITVPLEKAFCNEYLVTPIPLLETNGENHISFKVCFKRNLGLLSTNDLVVAYRYMDDFRLRRHLLAIYKQAEFLKRIWIIDPELTAGLQPSDQASSSTFTQNRTGLYLECRCGVYVYIGRSVETISQWIRCWTLHLSPSTASTVTHHSEPGSAFQCRRE